MSWSISGVGFVNWSISGPSLSLSLCSLLRMPVDLSLYLVTDSTPAILKGRDLCTVVEQAIQGGELRSFLSIYTLINHILGVTVVQYRDKSSDTGVLVENARKLHQITKKYNVPLLINDRVDVALAIGAEGVHLGQDDMSLSSRLRPRFVS